MTKYLDMIEYDSSTNLPIVTDINGNVHILPWEILNKDTSCERVYLQSWITNYTWSSTSNFNKIPDFRNAGKFLTFFVPVGMQFNLSFIIAAQSKHNQPDKGNCISSLGLFINGNFKALVPFKNEIYYVLFSPIAISDGLTVELMYLPYDKKCDLGVIAGGPLIDCERHEHK